MKTIVFIDSHLAQPRHIKRISSLISAGIPVKVYGFDAGVYSSNIDKIPFKVEMIVSRDKKVNLLFKIYGFAKFIKYVLSKNRCDSVFYLFGFEFVIIAWLLGCRNYIYEEADISASRIKNVFIKRLLLCIDRFLYRKAKLVVITSAGFIKYLFPNCNSKILSNIQLQPNKLHPIFTNEKRKNVKLNPIKSGHIKFGFIGLIRYPNTIIRFARVIGRHFLNHEFHFYGDLQDASYIDHDLEACSNVFFHGGFRNPEDLQSIYEQVDINIVCYDTNSDNVRIAEPNKLYESIYFYTPIVVSEGTYLAERVKDLKIGYVINCAKDDDIVDFIRGISIEDFLMIQERMRMIPTDELVDNPLRMIKRIKRIL